jgi:hypothetical protein
MHHPVSRCKPQFEKHWCGGNAFGACSKSFHGSSRSGHGRFFVNLSHFFFHESCYLRTVTGHLKDGIVEPEKTFIGRQRLGKHVLATTNMQATIEVLLETMFYTNITFLDIIHRPVFL